MAEKETETVINNLFIIEGLGEGIGLGRYQGIVVFVPYAAPGDVVDVRIIKKKSNYWEGEILEIRSPSPCRVQPVCSHFGVCGGCRWQHIDYYQQLIIKEKSVKDALERLGSFREPPMHPIIEASDVLYYRNKLEFSYGDRRWLTTEQIRSEQIFEHRCLGFHIPGRFDRVLHIEQCYLQADPSNDIRRFAYDFALKHQLPFINLKTKEGLVRHIIIRNTPDGEFMVIWVLMRFDKKLCEMFTSELLERFPQVVSVYVAINNKLNDSLEGVQLHHLYGQKHLVHNIHGLKFHVGPLSFFQTNTRQAARLYGTALSLAQLRGDEVVYDLYCGTGTIGAYFSSHAERVLGFELVVDAIADGRLNIERNNIKNMELVQADLSKISPKDFFKSYPKPDVVIVDPPRAGIDRKVLSFLLSVKPKKIVYISCHPATQAANLKALSELYTLEVVQPVDMFPQTHHVENIVILTKN